MSKLVEMLKNQSGRLSMGRVCSVITFFLWVFTWMYTLILKQSYSHFDTVTMAMLVMVFSILLNKTVDSKLISIKVGEK